MIKLPKNDLTCPQTDSLSPKVHRDLAIALDNEYAPDDFRSRIAKLLGGVVQVPTVTYDDMGDVGEDPRWDVFAELHDYLKDAFPLVHKHLELTKVNTYGLVYRWEGSDDSLKPILLMGHQDVVPVNEGTISEWIHGPFSGYFDGSNY